MPSDNNVAPLRPTRVLHVLGTLNRGGLETWLRHAVACLPRERYQCDFCTYRSERGTYAGDLERLGCGMHFIPLGLSPIAVWRFTERFRRLLRGGRYDVVHCHGLLLVGFILFLAWMENTPVRIAHAHNTRTNRNFAGVVAAAIRLALLLNRPLVRAFSTRGVGCSAEAATALLGGRWQENTKYRVIHCGIHLIPFEAAKSLSSQRTALGIGPDAKVIGHVGSFSAAKNHRFLVDVAAHVFGRRADVMLLLVGDGALRRPIEQSCADLGISSRVIFAGVSSCVPELMRYAMDVFVMPSLHEGLPLVLLEAQAAGLPSLVSDVVSHEAMIADGTIQFLPLASGAEAWGDAVLMLLGRATRRPDLVAQMANSDFNIVVSAKHLENLYDDGRAGRAGGYAKCLAGKGVTELETKAFGGLRGGRHGLGAASTLANGPAVGRA